jgi:hypothetical protein
MNAGAFGPDVDRGARRHPLDGTKGHQKRPGLPKPHNLSGKRRGAPPGNLRTGPDREPRHSTPGFDKEARDSSDPTCDHQGFDLLDGFDKVLQDADSPSDSDFREWVLQP